jgi:UDP-N-acetylglucosamine 2-epimerase (non-hydrolysing)
VKLIGTDEERIVAEVSALLTDTDAYEAMARATNPYGDGRGAERSVRAIAHSLGLGERPSEYA